MSGLTRGEQRRRREHVSEEPVVDDVGEDQERAEDPDREQDPRAHAARQDQQREQRHHGRDHQAQPVGDRGRLEQRGVRKDQRLGRQGRRAPRHVGHGSGAHPQSAIRLPQSVESPEREQQRQRREDPRRRRDDDDQRARLARRDLREPGHALLDHVPLQPVHPGQGRRDDASLQRDACPRRHSGGAEIRPDAVVIWHGPRSVRQLARHQPQPVIRQVHARRIPGAPAAVAHRHRHGDFLRGHEQPRR